MLGPGMIYLARNRVKFPLSLINYHVPLCGKLPISLFGPLFCRTLKDQYDRYREESFQGQVPAYREKRKREILANAERFFEGKKRKITNRQDITTLAGIATDTIFFLFHFPNIGIWGAVTVSH